MTENTKLTYEKITDRYYKTRYLGLECIMDTTNGYINGTKLYLSAKDKSKRIVKYIDGLRCKMLINYYMSNITQYSDDLSIHVVDGIKEIRGTYLHPILFLDLAIWISPSAYIKANTIITAALLKDKESDKETYVDKKLSNLEKSLEEVIKKREESIINIITQNDFSKSLENIENDSSKIKLSLKRLETKIETKSVDTKQKSCWKKAWFIQKQSFP